MPLNITNSADGAIKKAFKVYIQERALLESDNFAGISIDSYIEELIASPNMTYTDLLTLIEGVSAPLMARFGLTIKDDTEASNIAKGESVMTEEGEVVVDKKGTSKASLINLTKTNISALEELDRKNVDILYIDEGISNLNEMIICVFNQVFNFEEQIKGGGISVLPFNVDKDVSAAGSFRKVITIPSGLNTPTMVHGLAGADSIPVSWGKILGTETYHLEIDKINDFNPINPDYEQFDVSSNLLVYTFIGLDASTLYYMRMRSSRIKDGVTIYSDWSPIISESTQMI